VIDSGIGLSKVDRDRILSDSTRLSRTSRAAMWDGAGPSIAKELVELHGGRIWVESVEGKAVVYLHAPPRTAHRPMSELAKTAKNGPDSYESTSIEVEPRIMRTGLKRAMARSGETLLCAIGPTSIASSALRDCG